MCSQTSAPLREGKAAAGDYELLEYLCGSCRTRATRRLPRPLYQLLTLAENGLWIDGDRAESASHAPGLRAPDYITVELRALTIDDLHLT